ncbi:3-carboxymuconate cyclase [Planoprotostelium fungivorum]|uniref:3-carboxymuconate cyclase n=1 Tax=Planoprotostelium fungivorum TaxID=1890364 RepID=A0A2P6MZC6_9EUKA|nr:3-carboxymuconate cyclase [Planoprotostelium fungivorum]
MRTAGVLLGLLSIVLARNVYIGSLNSGIWIFQQNGDGSLSQVGNPVTSSSGFVALHPNGQNLFATGAGDQYVSYGMQGNNLVYYNSLPGHDGQECWTTHVSVHPDGKTLFGANYKDGSFVAYSLWDNGALNRRTFLNVPGTGSHGDKTDQHRQDGPHAHMIVTSPNPKFVVGMDLGADRIWVWKYNSQNNSLTPNRPRSFSTPLGSGSRHIAFGRDGNYAYVVNEIACTLLVLKFDQTNGIFSQVQLISSLPQDQQGQTSISAGEIRVHPSGNFVYVTNRNTWAGDMNNIGIFSINTTTGMVTPVAWEPSRSRSPRGMNVCPSGNYLYVANEEADNNGNNLFAFNVDTSTGRLSLFGSYSTKGSASDVEFTYEKLSPVPQPTTSRTFSSTSRHSTSTVTPSTTTSVGDISLGMDRWGGDMDNMPVWADGPQGCQQQCYSTSGCVAWAYNTCDGGNCWLKNSNSSPYSSNCRATGTIFGRV